MVSVPEVFWGSWDGAIGGTTTSWWVARASGESEEKREGARLGVQIAQKADDARREDIRDGIELGREIAREIVGDNE